MLCYITHYSAHLFTRLDARINCLPTKAKITSSARKKKRPSCTRFLATWDETSVFYSSINQHGLNTLLTRKSSRFWLVARFSPNFLLFSSSANLLVSSVPFRVFRCYSVSKYCIPCCLPTPIISSMCFCYPSAVLS